MGLFKKIKDPLRGSAQVVSCNMPTGRAVLEQGHLELVVSADGVPATPVRHSGLFRTSQWPMPGQTLPITLDRADPQRIKIHWDEVPSGKHRAEQHAQQLAARMNAQPAASAQGAGNLSGTPAGLSEDQAARVSQALAGLGVGGLGSAQVVDLRGQAGTPGANAERDPIDQLEKLAELRKSGALTDAEFEQQKKADSRAAVGGPASRTVRS
jgi:hypothetical protein